MVVKCILIVYDDRMEIIRREACQTVPLFRTEIRITVPSTRRNPVLADIFNRLEYMERKGSGIWQKSSAAMNFRSTMMKVKSRILDQIGTSLQL